MAAKRESFVIFSEVFFIFITPNLFIFFLSVGLFRLPMIYLLWFAKINKKLKNMLHMSNTFKKKSQEVVFKCLQLLI